MTWVRSDDSKPLNRKVRPLSDGAYRLDDHALHYCARHETDGLIYAADFDEITLGLKGKHHQQYIAELVAIKLWHSAGEHCSSEECPAARAEVAAGTWAKHDYFTRNKTHDELERERRSVKAARSKGGRAAATSGQLEAARSQRWPQASQPEHQPEAQPDPQPEAVSGSRPVPSRPVPSLIVSNETIVSLVPPDPRAERLVEQLSAVLSERGVKFKAGKEWHVDADRLIRLDKRDVEEAVELLDWATRHHFWASNILSVGKFREKYDQLRLQRERELTQPVRSDPMHERARQLLAKAQS